MEVHTAPAAAKRMWSYLRAVFFMVRKGVLSNKRKLFVSMHLLMKRRNKAVARTVANLLSHHHHHHHHYYGNALRRREYEFSCSNSPDPASGFSFSSGSSSSSRRPPLAYLPCLGSVAEEDVAWPAPLGCRIEYAAANFPAEPLAGSIEEYAVANSSPAPSSLAPGEEESFCVSPAPPGAFSVRVSNFSSEDEGAGSQAVDDEAEEFIRRFYEQLRRQNNVAMLPYMQESAA